MPSRKVALGQFYTSHDVVDLMLDLAGDLKSHKVLEPSSGPGAFVDRLVARGAADITACDIDVENCQTVAEAHPDVTVIHGSFLNLPPSRAYDTVIGNPPYVSWPNLDPAIKQQLRSDAFWKPLSNGQWDLLYAFLIWSVQQLKPGGQLIQIVPFNWFNSTYAQSLRDHLAANGHFTHLIHFGELKLFHDCYPNCLIFRWVHAPSDRMARVVEHDAKTGLIPDVLTAVRRALLVDGDLQDGDVHSFAQEQPRAGQVWHLASRAQLAVSGRVERACEGRTLADVADVLVGQVSGLDAAFAVTSNQTRDWGAADRRLVREFVKARSCQPYGLGATQSMIFTEAVADVQAVPDVEAHLAQRRPQLEARYLPTGKQWWHWATVRNLRPQLTAQRSVLFVPCIDRSPRPRFCRAQPRSGLLAAGDTLAIIPQRDLNDDDRYVLAWLNSTAVRDWYRIKGSRTGHRYRYTQAYVSRIPYLAVDHADAAQASIHDTIIQHVGDIEAGRLSVADGQQLLDQQFENLITLRTP